MPRLDNRRGFALIEVLASLVVLALGSTTLVGLLLQSDEALRRGARRERTIVAAAEVMTRVSLWSRADLETNRGLSQLEGLTVRVVASSPTLFDIAVMNRSGGDLLRTVLFRPSDAR